MKFAQISKLVLLKMNRCLTPKEFQYFSVLKMECFEGEGGVCRLSIKEIADLYNFKYTNLTRVHQSLLGKKWIMEADGGIKCAAETEGGEEVAKNATGESAELRKTQLGDGGSCEKRNSDEREVAKNATVDEESCEKRNSLETEGGEKVAKNATESCEKRNFSGVHIRNLEFRQEQNRTEVLPPAGAREKSVGAVESDFDFENWSKPFLRRDENNKIILSDEENRMKDPDFYEHLSKLNPHLGGLKQVQIRVGELFAVRPNARRIHIKRWVCGQAAALEPPPESRLPTESPPLRESGGSQIELEAKIREQRTRAKDLYKNGKPANTKRF